MATPTLPMTDHQVLMMLRSCHGGLPSVSAEAQKEKRVSVSKGNAMPAYGSHTAQRAS